MNSLEPGSHMLAKKTAYLFDTDFKFKNLKSSSPVKRRRKSLRAERKNWNDKNKEKEAIQISRMKTGIYVDVRTSDGLMREFLKSASG